MGRPRKWTKRKVVQEIRRQGGEGKTLAHGRVAREAPALAGAARTHFGSWAKAVEAAGYDYQAVLFRAKQETLARRKPRNWWDATKVVQAIRERYNAGKPISGLAVLREDTPLHAAAFRHLGSWERAVELATGIPYEEIRLNHPWSREEILEAIRARHARGETLRGSVVLREANTLYNAARVHYGTWKEAVEAAGFNWLATATSWTWDEEKLLAALREWARSGKRGLPRELQTPVLSRYGSWGKALEAAGLDPSLAETRSLRHTWTKEEVLEAIRERAKCGKGLLHSDLRRDDVRLLEAARRLFGTWVKARAEALSVEPRRVRSWPPGAKAR